MCLAKTKVPKIKPAKVPPVPEPPSPPEPSPEAPVLNEERKRKKDDKDFRRSLRGGTRQFRIDLTIPTGNQGGSGINFPK